MEPISEEVEVGVRTHLKCFFAKRNAWDQKWFPLLGEFDGSEDELDKLEAKAEQELRSVFREFCKSPTEIEDGLSYQNPPPYQEAEIREVRAGRKKNLVAVVRIKESGGQMDYYFEIEHAKSGFKILNRKYKGVSGKLEKHFL